MKKELPEGVEDCGGHPLPTEPPEPGMKGRWTCENGHPVFVPAAE